MGRCCCIVAAFLMVVGLVAVGTVEGCAEDLVQKLPGQPDVPFKQYAGYVNVDEKNGRSLFYYFVEAYDNAKNKPLLLWLNGGPGCSSVGVGGFVELGPFYPTGDGLGLRLNTNSWNKEANIIFLDSPVGVGWSYSNTSSDYIIGDEKTAMDGREFLLGWFKKFPEYRSRSFFIAGESYAAHFVPQLAALLLDYNKMSTGFKFNLKGVALGNPLIHLARDQAAQQEYLWSHGIHTDEAWERIVRECNFQEWMATGRMNETDECRSAIDDANQANGDLVDFTDIMIDLCDEEKAKEDLVLKRNVTKMSLGVDVCIFKERTAYFNLPEVQKALHANRTGLPYRWNVCNPGPPGQSMLQYAFSGNNMVPVMKELIGNNTPVFIYSGDLDQSVPFSGTRRIIAGMADELQLDVTRPYKAWMHDKETGGWAVEYGNLLTFATVKGGSHMVPLTQPERSLGILRAFLNKQQLPYTKPLQELRG